MPKIVFKFNNFKKEIKRIERCISDIDFYIANNYFLSWPDFPNSILEQIKNKNISKKSKQIIFQTIKKEINSKIFLINFKRIQNDWQKKEEIYFKKAEKFLHIKPLSKYTCWFTRYGVGGSYYPPKDFVVNIVTCKFPVKTIGHEITHLMIHKYIEKYKVNHWQKERLVDLYMKKIFKDYFFQNISQKAEIKKVDSAFQKYFNQGAEIIIKNI